MHKSILSKPTVYESFARSWITSASATTSPRNSTTAATATATGLVKSASQHSSSSLLRNHGIGGSAFSKQQQSSFSKGQVRGMASTQPLTQSTMPTAQELKIQTPLDQIKTASGVKLDDSQKVFVASILDLFAGKPSLRILSLWTDNATFNDPITLAEGRKQYSAQWYGLATAFSSIERLSHTVTSAGNPITLDLSTRYKVKGLGTEKVIDSVVEIYVDEKGESGGTGKIVKVLDKWDGSIEGGGVKHAFRKLNAVSVPTMVSVPKSIEEEEGSGK